MAIKDGCSCSKRVEVAGTVETVEQTHGGEAGIGSGVQNHPMHRSAGVAHILDLPHGKGQRMFTRVRARVTPPHLKGQNMHASPALPTHNAGRCCSGAELQYTL